MKHLSTVFVFISVPESLCILQPHLTPPTLSLVFLMPPPFSMASSPLPAAESTSSSGRPSAASFPWL
uniref:Uncharacterized protein n=1 Tax=Triticum urartu TaxID=4572 RepID=A0A8R7PJ24_TRIUA